MSNLRPLTWLVLVSLATLVEGIPSAIAEEPTSAKPTITIRAIHPEREFESVFDLFQGSRVANPAAAMAAWKRASPEPKRLGKPLEAVIALFNPRMLAEYRLLDSGEVAIGFGEGPGSGRYPWRAWLPNDDGTLEALGPTGVLSGGELGPPIVGFEVDRLGGPGSTLLARGPSGLLLANSRDQLEAAISRSKRPITPPPIASGFAVEVDPSSFESWTTLAGRRWAEAARSARSLAISGQTRLDGGTLVASLAGRYGSPPSAIAPVDPSWLDCIPDRGPLAAFAIRVDRRPESWDAVFQLLDRVERADPERANMASTRIRAALAARAFGVRLEADVRGHLEGVSGWFGVGGGKLDRGLVAVHLDDKAVAKRLLGGIKGRRTEADPSFDESVELGSVAGRSFRVSRRGASVLVAWGDRTWPESVEAITHPGRSARRWMASSRAGAGPSPSRVGAVWVDQIPSVPAGSPMATTLSEAPPIRWAGWNEADQTCDEVWVDGLDASVRRFLQQIPLSP